MSSGPHLPPTSGPACALPSGETPSYDSAALVFLAGVKAQVYIKPTCPYCVQVVDILADLKVNLEVYDVSDEPELRQKVSQSVGGFPTVPMIFIKKKFIGGCDDLISQLQEPEKLRALIAV